VILLGNLRHEYKMRGAIQLTDFTANDSATMKSKVQSKASWSREHSIGTGHMQEKQDQELHKGNPVVEAQKQMSSQQTVGLPPQE